MIQHVKKWIQCWEVYERNKKDKKIVFKKKHKKKTKKKKKKNKFLKTKPFKNQLQSIKLKRNHFMYVFVKLKTTKINGMLCIVHIDVVEHNVGIVNMLHLHRRMYQCWKKKTMNKKQKSKKQRIGRCTTTMTTTKTTTTTKRKRTTTKHQCGEVTLWTVHLLQIP